MSPVYVYQCIGCGDEKEWEHPMDENPEIICGCGRRMMRKPQPFMLNYGQIKGEELHPNIRHLLETAPERRAEFERRHEEHERLSEKEMDL